jgi:hypothetical protein
MIVQGALIFLVDLDHFQSKQQYLFGANWSLQKWLNNTKTKEDIKESFLTLHYYTYLPAPDFNRTKRDRA